MSKERQEALRIEFLRPDGLILTTINQWFRDSITAEEKEHVVGIFFFRIASCLSKSDCEEFAKCYKALCADNDWPDFLDL